MHVLPWCVRSVPSLSVGDDYGDDDDDDGDDDYDDDNDDADDGYDEFVMPIVYFCVGTDD